MMAKHISPVNSFKDPYVAWMRSGATANNSRAFNNLFLLITLVYSKSSCIATSLVFEVVLPILDEDLTLLQYSCFIHDTDQVQRVRDRNMRFLLQ